nr:MAG TPA: hypothetical protein [Caudoviricetes sp.]
MIDFGKVQADAVKNIYKSKITGKAGDYRIYGVSVIAGNEYVSLMYKGISIYLIPERHYLLTLGLAGAGYVIENIFKSVETADQLTDTKVIKILSDGRQLKEFKTKDDKSIFVDEKLIKPFGQNLRYYAGENSDIVYIKEVDEWLGLAFATRIVKENE